MLPASLLVATPDSVARTAPAASWILARAAATSSTSSTAPDALLLAATDPAQPWGAALDWPAVQGSEDGGRTKHRPGRKAGALVVLVAGTPTLYVERGGKSLLSFTTDPEALRHAAEELAAAVRDGRLAPLAVERADGVSALGAELGKVLTAAGFRATPKALRLRA